MRLILCLALFGAAAASAQGDPAGADLNRQLREAASQTDTLVLSVTEQEGRFVYDLPGEMDVRAFLFNQTGAFIVRAPDADRVLVVVEPSGLPATSATSEVPQIYTGLVGPNTALLTPEAPIAEFRLREYGPSDFNGDPDGPIATYHRVRILACADGRGGACQTWTRVAPRSGGGDLYLIIVDGPSERM